MSDPSEADLVFEVDLDAPPEKVWRALATPELRKAWLGEPGSGAADATAVTPGRRLDLAWSEDGADSAVSFEIAPNADGGARLRIVHVVRARPTAIVLPICPRRPVAMACAYRKAA